MKKLLILLGIVLLLVLGYVFFVSGKQGDKQEVKQETSQQTTSPENINYRASFAIFTNNTYRVFDDPKYYNQSPDVYMEEANIVIVKKKGITWSDFFATLPMSLKEDCLVTGTGQTFCTNETQRLRFFINSKEDKDALNKEIVEGDKLLVTYGEETENQIKNQLQQVP